MNRTIYEILEELEANRRAAAQQIAVETERKTAAEFDLAAATKAVDDALKNLDHAAYDQAAQDKAFAAAVLKNINEAPLFYTPEQIQQIENECHLAHADVMTKYAKKLAPLVQQIQQIESEANAEIAQFNKVSAILRATLECNPKGEWKQLPTAMKTALSFFFHSNFPRLPYEYYTRVFERASK